MKRLIDTKKKQTFKNWVIQHDPKNNWNFNNPEELKQQLIETIQGSGDLDIRTIFEIMFANEESGLTFNQTVRFLGSDY